MAKSKKPKKLNPAKAKRKLDRLFSQLILERDDRVCQWCGRGVPDVKVDTSHIIPREILVLRWDPSNAVALCFSCHKKRGTSWHGSPLESVAWLRQTIGNERCDELIVKAKQPFVLSNDTVAAIESDLRARLSSIQPVLCDHETTPTS